MSPYPEHKLPSNGKNEGPLPAVDGGKYSAVSQGSAPGTVFCTIKPPAQNHTKIPLAQGPPAEIRLTVVHPGTLSGKRVAGLGSTELDYLTLRHSLTEKAGVVTFEGFFPSPR